MTRTKAIITTAILGSLFLATTVLAQPKPGDVYREYRWHPTPDSQGRANSRLQRVTGPDATIDRAKAFLPNLVNSLQVDDFEHAVRAEMSLEVLNVHPGTQGHEVRLNGGDWLPIPFSPLVPGNSGKGLPALEYHTMQYPVVPVSLDSLKNGLNTFEFTASRGTALANRWPQWMSYGASIRIYYDESAKEHPTGQISSHQEGAKVGENEGFSASTTSSTPIRQVEFVGKYSDFNWKGDGNYRQWQDQTLYSEVRNHIGTATQAPFNVTWDNDWVPDQDEPMEVSARIVDNTGLTYVTPSVTGLELVRPYSVEMHKPYDVPKKWASRKGGTHRAKIDVADDPSDATAAKITLATWNGTVADAIRMNEKFVREHVGSGGGHNLSYDTFDVPVDFLKRGTNVFSTFSDTDHHAIDVQWPGPVLFVRHETIPEPSTSGLLGMAFTGLLARRHSLRPCSLRSCDE